MRGAISLSYLAAFLGNKEARLNFALEMATVPIKRRMIFCI